MDQTTDVARQEPAAQVGRITRVAGIGLNVSDLERSADFYTRILGLAEVMRVPPNGPTHEVVLSLSGAVTDTLVVLSKLNDAPLASGSGAFGRIIMNAADATAIGERARAAGFDVSRLGNAASGGPTVFFVTDPDGYQVELYQPASQ